MEKVDRAFVRKLIRAIISVIVLGYIFYGAEQITYAFMENSTPDVQITINEDGGITYNGNIFGTDLWYPGKEESGIIRITNQFKQVDINSFGLNVLLNGFKEGYDRDFVYESLLKNMKLSVVKGKLFVFDETLVDNKTFSELLWDKNDDSSTRFALNESGPAILPKNESLDLRYNLYMDDQSGEELESITAAVDFLINIGDRLE